MLNLNISIHYTQKLKTFIISHNHQEQDFDSFNQLKKLFKQKNEQQKDNYLHFMLYK